MQDLVSKAVELAVGQGLPEFASKRGQERRYSKGK